MDFVVRYLGSITPGELAIILGVGLAFIPVTFGIKHGTALTGAFGKTYGERTVSQMHALGLPKGATVALDLEDATGSVPDVIAFVEAWASEVVAAEYIGMIYVGAGALLSSVELYALKGITRYWQSLSKELDARGQLAEPGCGWCMIQLYLTDQVVAGLNTDLDVIQKDYRGRIPSWIVA
jgi:hypothetical protein